MTKLTTSERLLWARLLCAQSPLGANKMRNLRQWLENNHLSIADFWQDLERLCPLLHVPAKQQSALRQVRDQWPSPRLAEHLARQQIKIADINDHDYPALLRYIPDWPPVLFYQGHLEVLSRLGVAVVGARALTAYGQLAIEQLITPQWQDLVVISGMMTGADEWAHRRALSLGIPTAAFLGYGLNNVWPANLAALKHEIVASGGVLVSEFAPWSQSRPFHFPLRNRLVAGSSALTLVIEAAVNSGSLITARLALDYGRDVLAVPGSIMSELSRGCLELIKKGALPVASSQEVLTALSESKIQLLAGVHAVSLPIASPVVTATTSQTCPDFGDPWQNQVYALVLSQKLDTEGVCTALGAQAPVLTALGFLELSGEIIRGNDGYWRAQLKS
ncbi:DNA-processing protein DprA [bacterium]|nr:DNA-processing protein DprA [bacterium]